MLFNSSEFLFFFPIVLLVYFFIFKKYRKVLLLVTSYFFYMCWNPKYIILIIVCTLSTWYTAIIIDRLNNVNKRKVVFILGLIINLSILLTFKYLNFLLQNVLGILKFFNMHIVSNCYVDIILPVGISFYTFQALSYLIDVYRKEIIVEKNILNYALYISFFPQLVAGPIERPQNLLIQFANIQECNLFDYKRVTKGCKTMIYGYFLKLVIADRIAPYVDVVFEGYDNYNFSILITACVLFAIQIYCDFNGYSLIAIGAAKIMGIQLMENFNTPYLSQSVTEFWRRWHISLTTWFRDYIYIPLGGNKCSKIRNGINIIIVFLLSGLWHGANWTFIIWGGINGLYQVLEKFIVIPIEAWLKNHGSKTSSFSYKALKTAITFSMVDFAWIFFRSPTITDALSYIKRMFTRFDPWSFIDNNVLLNLLPQNYLLIELKIALTAIFFMIIIDIVSKVFNKSICEVMDNQCIWFRWGIYIAMILAIVVFGVYGSDFTSADFIYFQF